MRVRHRQSGFTLIELLVVAAAGMVIVGIAVPAVAEAIRLSSLNTSVQTVASAIRSARYLAVSTNRTVRVRFNCPAANEFRVVEVVGAALIDQAANRCSGAAYPYP